MLRERPQPASAITARTPDPPLLFQSRSSTSRAAAMSMRAAAPNQRERVLSFIVARGPVTGETVALELGMRMASVSARIHELATAGLITDGGRGRTTAGRQAVLWVGANQ